MKRVPRGFLASFGASCLVLVVACNQAPAQAAARSRAVAVAEVTTSSNIDGLQPEHAATLADGIRTDVRKLGSAFVILRVME
jgi:hypothetical protein